jgi:hypothetical protein
MDPVTLIGLLVVAVMFSVGVGLVYVGLRRRPDRLPLYAEDVLAAVADGRIAHPEPVIDLVKPPAEPPRASKATPAVRLLRKAPAAAPAATAPAADLGADDDGFSDALFAGIDDPTAATGAEFFANEPELQRF